ncbi:hypothetical protein SAMN05421748_15410 [Paractinoplanes atraurantiacus]|uniref:Uncharacterized protein n=1 Tax=Paractinoplanes atraurantiacus TaxID=1036182 RepID=A0A285KQQ0_9ACTN|nr:hypothetical protein SAMN05421748_15410 [Actinoplanes atraurantiacus]
MDLGSPVQVVPPGRRPGGRVECGRGSRARIAVAACLESVVVPTGVLRVDGRRSPSPPRPSGVAAGHGGSRRPRPARPRRARRARLGQRGRRLGSALHARHGVGTRPAMRPHDPLGIASRRRRGDRLPGPLVWISRVDGRCARRWLLQPRSAELCCRHVRLGSVRRRRSLARSVAPLALPAGRLGAGGPDQSACHDSLSLASDRADSRDCGGADDGPTGAGSAHLTDRSGLDPGPGVVAARVRRGPPGVLPRLPPVRACFLSFGPRPSQGSSG